MTYADFLAKLRETPREWTNAQGYLRLHAGVGHSLCCPITAVEARRMGAQGFDEAGHALGLSLELIRSIVGAADCIDDWNRDIRRDLLDACGLTESR